VKAQMGVVRTDVLEIRYEAAGPPDGPAVLLIHGWPDAPRGWREVAVRLQSAGWRTIIPYLRGCGLTRFVSPDIPRVGHGVALARDIIDLADALELGRFAVVGHDWGARAAYTTAALFPGRVTAVAGLALAYQPRGIFTVPGFEQAKAFWYQWFMCLDQGADAVRRDPVGFARLQWDTWSPPGWFNYAEFTATAENFTNPDWVDITLHAYRARYLTGEASDPRYDQDVIRLGEIERLSSPVLMIQGGSDSCDEPQASQDMEQFFTGSYRRIVLDGVGHFPHREAPGPVARAVIDHLQAHT
jgi:pimeloyl-ACP methyl ester carboxylesterase